MSSCRICHSYESTFYDIFEDELSLESMKKSLKIYIVLNNFLHEKLYYPDDYSSLMCLTCCESLYSSYCFMTKVHESERKHHQNFIEIIEPESKKAKIEIQFNEQSQVVENELIDTDSIVADEYDNYLEEDEHVELKVEEEPQLEIKEVAMPRNSAVSTTKNNNSVTFSSYSLVLREEKGQSYASIKVELQSIETKDFSSDYEFSVPSFSDPLTIYSCLYCVKAFGNLDMLLKHTCSCHICAICLEIKQNYKDLANHFKKHQEKLGCPFCAKSFNSSTFRQHIRKQHISNLPSIVYLKPK